MLPARSLARLAPLVPPVRPGRAAWAGGRRFSAATAKSKFIVEVNGRDEFDRVVVQSKVPVVLDAYADWCGPCRLLAPILEDAVNKQEGKVILAKLNTDNNDELAAELRVRSLPMVMAIVNGKVTDSFIGFSNAQKVGDFVKRAISKAD